MSSSSKMHYCYVVSTITGRALVVFSSKKEAMRYINKMCFINKCMYRFSRCLLINF